MYSLGGVDLSSFGGIPIRQDSSDIALSGHLDMPARLGTTSFSWSEEHGEEPYVTAEDIAVGGFAGRDITFLMLITGSDQYEANARLAQYYAHIDTFTGLVPLATDFGTYQVYVSSAIVGEMMPTGGSLIGIKVTTIFREPVVSRAGTVPAVTNAEFGIDGISFSDLGGAYLELTGDRYNRPAPKSQEVTAFGKEAYAITKQVSGELGLKLGIKANTYAALRDKVQGLMALLSAPGLHSLTVNNDRLRSFYVKDGFTTTMIHAHETPCFCVVEVRLIESGDGVTFTELADSLGNIITDIDGNTIMVRL